MRASAEQQWTEASSVPGIPRRRTGCWAGVGLGMFVVTTGAAAWFAWAAHDRAGWTPWVVLGLTLTALTILLRRAASRGTALAAAAYTAAAAATGLIAFATAGGPTSAEDRLARIDLPPIDLATAGLLNLVAAGSAIALALRRGHWLGWDGADVGILGTRLTALARAAGVGSVFALTMVAASQPVVSAWQEHIADRRIDAIVTHTVHAAVDLDHPSDVGGPPKPGRVAWTTDGMGDVVHRGGMLVTWEEHRDDDGDLTSSIVAHDVRTGAERWRFTVADSHGFGDVAVGVTSVVAIVGDDVLICLDLENGARIATRRLPETSGEWRIVRDETSRQIIDTGIDFIFLRNSPNDATAIVRDIQSEAEIILGLRMPSLRIELQQDVPASMCEYAVVARLPALVRGGSGCGAPIITIFHWPNALRPHAQITLTPPAEVSLDSCAVPCALSFQVTDVAANGRLLALVISWDQGGQEIVGMHDDGDIWRLPIPDDSHWYVYADNRPDRDGRLIVTDGKQLHVLDWFDGHALTEASPLQGEQAEAMVIDGDRAYILTQNSTVVVRDLHPARPLAVLGAMPLPRSCAPASWAPPTVGGGVLVIHCRDDQAIVLVDGPDFQIRQPDIVPW
ncbi:MAG: hypothetical protein ACRDJH_22830 [Thermomicrobiales bacterium]